MKSHLSSAAPAHSPAIRRVVRPFLALFVVAAGFNLRAASLLYLDLIKDGSPKTSVCGVHGDYIVGNYIVPEAAGNGERPFLYTISQNAFAELPQAPGANVTVALGVTVRVVDAQEKVEIVGYYFTNWPSGPAHGFVYNRTDDQWQTIDYAGAPGGLTLFGKSGDWVIGSTNKDSGEALLLNVVTLEAHELKYPGSVWTRFTGIGGGLIAGDYLDGTDFVRRGFTYEVATQTWSAPFEHPDAVADLMIHGTDGQHLVGSYQAADGRRLPFVYVLNSAPAEFYVIENFAGSVTQVVGISGNYVVGEYTAHAQIGFLAKKVDQIVSSENTIATFTAPNTGTTWCTLDFDGALAGGTSAEASLSISLAGPAEPEGFKIGDPPTYYHIETTAEITGLVRITLCYEGVTLSDPEGIPTLLHYHNGAWEEVAITEHDPVAKTLTGYVDSFSPFGVLTQPYEARILPPIAADGTSAFPARRGVVPVKFALFNSRGRQTGLQAARIAVYRKSGDDLILLSPDLYASALNDGDNFRVLNRQYVYELSAERLGAGTYVAELTIAGKRVGSGSFRLR